MFNIVRIVLYCVIRDGQRGVGKWTNKAMWWPWLFASAVINRVRPSLDEAVGRTGVMEPAGSNEEIRTTTTSADTTQRNYSPCELRQSIGAILLPRVLMTLPTDRWRSRSTARQRSQQHPTADLKVAGVLCLTGKTGFSCSVGILAVFIYYPVPDRSGDGVLFSIDSFVYIFVSLLARLRENGWTDLHEIFREGVKWPWDDLITVFVNSEKPRDAAMRNTGTGFVVLSHHSLFLHLFIDKYAAILFLVSGQCMLRSELLSVIRRWQKYSRKRGPGFLKPNTHRRRDLTVELSHVGVERCVVEFATSSRRLPTDLLEKLITEHDESSWVVSGGVYSPVGSRDPVSNSAANSTG